MPRHTGVGLLDVKVAKAVVPVLHLSKIFSESTSKLKKKGMVTFGQDIYIYVYFNKQLQEVEWDLVAA